MADTHSSASHPLLSPPNATDDAEHVQVVNTSGHEVPPPAPAPAPAPAPQQLQARASNQSSHQSQQSGQTSTQAQSGTASLASQKEHAHREDEAEKEPSAWHRFWSNTWAFEILSMSFSIACTVAILVILGIYDGKPLSPLPYGLTLNAIVSTLATGAEGALMAVVASSLSQIKWRWFQDRKQHKLYQFQAFDDASRGAWGSFELLIGRIANIIAISGAIITILSLAFDPFVQQVIRYPIQASISQDQTALTHRASGFRPYVDGPAMTNAINAGLWADASQFARVPVCSSGNCKWSEFDSLGWCAKCADVTAAAQLSPGCAALPGTNDSSWDCSVSLGSSGLSTTIATWDLAASDPYPNFGWANEILWTTHALTIGDESNEFPANALEHLTPIGPTVLGIEGPVAVFGYVQTTNDAANFSYVNVNLTLRVTKAEQCALTPCLRSYNMQVSNGTLQSQITSTKYGYIMNGTLGIAGQLQQLGVFNVACWQPDDLEIPYDFLGSAFADPSALPQDAGIETQYQFWGNAAQSAFCPVSPYVEKILPYLQTNTTSQFVLGGPPGPWDPNATSWEMTQVASNDLIGRIASTNLTYVVENLAASLTSLSTAIGNEAVFGSVETANTHIKVRWEWLIYPLFLEVAGALLLVFTMIQTKRTVLWRSSLLPLMFHGPERHLAPAPFDIAGMEKRADEVKMRLVQAEDAEGHALRGSQRISIS